jgi:hypothetical protein
MKDEELKIEEIEAVHTLDGYIRCNCICEGPWKKMMEVKKKIKEDTQRNKMWGRGPGRAARQSRSRIHDVAHYH